MTLPWLFISAMWFLPSPVSLSVYPAFSMAPATFRFLVMTPRHAENRRLCYGYTGPEDRLSCVDLDGEQARGTFTAYWSFRTAGEYQAVAVLTRIEAGRARIYREVQPFRVIGIEP